MYPAVIAVDWPTTNFEANLRMVESDLFQGLLSDKVSYIPKYTPLYGKMPITETPKPLYNAPGPFAAVLVRQSTRPLNSLFPVPTSEASLVRA